MFYEQLKALCDKNGTSPTAVTVSLGYSRGTMTNWKNGTTPNGDIVVRFSEFFGVSCDYLLTGKEPIQKSHSEKEVEIIELYSQLDREDQAEVRGYIKGLLRTDKYSKNFYEETGKLA